MTLELSQEICRREIQLLEVTSTVYEMENIRDRTKSRLDTAREKISECKDIEIETAENETQGEKRWRKNRAAVSYGTRRRT